MVITDLSPPLKVFGILIAQGNPQGFHEELQITARSASSMIQVFFSYNHLQFSSPTFVLH